MKPATADKLTFNGWRRKLVNFKTHWAFRQNPAICKSVDYQLAARMFDSFSLRNVDKDYFIEAMEKLQENIGYIKYSMEFPKPNHKTTSIQKDMLADCLEIIRMVKTDMERVKRSRGI